MKQEYETPPYRLLVLYSQLCSTEDTVGLIVWSAAEIAVTMICIGIPVCRPLYKNFLDRLLSGVPSRNERPSHTPLGLYTIGGSAMPSGGRSAGRDGKPPAVVRQGSARPTRAEKASGNADGNNPEGHEQSDEEILLHTGRGGVQRTRSSTRTTGSQGT